MFLIERRLGTNKYEKEGLIMPRRDGTGPAGRGPLLGRGMGECVVDAGRGLGRGLGNGLGKRGQGICGGARRGDGPGKGIGNIGKK